MTLLVVCYGLAWYIISLTIDSNVVAQFQLALCVSTVALIQTLVRHAEGRETQLISRYKYRRFVRHYFTVHAVPWIRYVPSRRAHNDAFKIKSISESRLPQNVRRISVLIPNDDRFSVADAARGCTSRQWKEEQETSSRCKEACLERGEHPCD